MLLRTNCVYMQSRPEQNIDKAWMDAKANAQDQTEPNNEFGPPGQPWESVTNSSISKETSLTTFWGTHVDIVIAHVIEVLTILLTTNSPKKHLCCY